jgi:hypothetical protein
MKALSRAFFYMEFYLFSLVPIYMFFFIGIKSILYIPYWEGDVSVHMIDLMCFSFFSVLGWVGGRILIMYAFNVGEIRLERRLVSVFLVFLALNYLMMRFKVSYESYYAVVILYAPLLMAFQFSYFQFPSLVKNND